MNSLGDPFAMSRAGEGEWLRGNMHTHTTESDGAVAPQLRVDGYVKAGYDFLAITDHHAITDISGLETPAGFVLVPGAELHPDNPFGGQMHHFVCLGITEQIDARNLAPQRVIDAVNKQGGSVWVAHPHWSSVNIMRDTMPLRDLAGLEVFNAVTLSHARPESVVHWDDWMEQSQRLYPVIANDDAHGTEEDMVDTYQSWTVVRSRERSVPAILEALRQGNHYCTTGPTIEDIQIERVPSDTPRVIHRAHIKCSEAVRILGVADAMGRHYWEKGNTFTEASFELRANSRWVRFEIIAPDGKKAWSNPFRLDNPIDN